MVRMQLFNVYLLMLAMLAGSVLYVACKKTGEQGLRATGISPDSGPAGNLVTITGSGFNTDPTLDSVTFNGMPALISHATATQLQVLVPAGASTGPVVVYVNGQSASGPVYTISAISVGALNPVAGLTGDTVTITGMGLSNSGELSGLTDLPAVKFNGKAATVVSATPTQVRVLVPARAGIGAVTVAIGGQTATGPVFNYLGIDSLFPVTGNVGTIIRIAGGFGTSPAQDTVLVHGVKAVIDSATSTRLVVTVPNGAATGKVVVQTGGRVLNGPVFTFVAPPTVASFLPTSGPAGARVTITGTGFSAITTENVVSFNGVAGVVDSAGPTSLVVTVPSGATTGAVQVAVNNQAVTGPVFAVQGLGIVALSPAFFIPPYVDTIRGSGFGTNPGADVVQYNGVSATVVSVVDTALVVQVPAGISGGVATVQVAGLTATSPVFTTQGVETFSGSLYGIANGPATQAEFNNITGIAVDAAGNLYVADAGANDIRKVDPYGTVSDFAGDAGGAAGYVDGQGSSAQFNNPLDIAIDKNGNLYVVDQNNNVVRKITTGGMVSTFVTLPSGDAPGGVAVDGANNVYITDFGGNGNGNVYEYNSSGTLLNTINNPNAQQLANIAVDGMGNIYTFDYSGGNLYQGSKLITNLPNQYYFRFSLAIGAGGKLLVVESAYTQVISFDPAANFAQTVLVGGAGVRGNYGYQDGPLSTALFSGLGGIAVDAYGCIYVGDANGRLPNIPQQLELIRKISLK